MKYVSTINLVEGEDRLFSHFQNKTDFIFHITLAFL